jgi:LmbE family N-acetylglucosaminyl deacetylase
VSATREPRRPAAGVPKAAGAGGDAVVLVLAHHDDEVFCAGHLLRALGEGASVRILWATAGGLATPGRRIHEGGNVRRLLELDAGAVRDLGLPDQNAVFSIARIAGEAESLLDQALGEAPGAACTIYTPAYEGGHPDHDAVNLAVAVLRARRPELDAYEFPLYRRGPCGMSVQSPHAAADTAGRPFSVLALDDEALRLRRCLARANASQLLPSLLPLLVLARAAGRGRAEPSRPLPAHDYTRPPHSGRVLYEFYTRRRFADFRAAALAALPETSAPASRLA